MSNTITITGRTGRDPELRFTPSGSAVLNGSVADTPRKFDRDRNEWIDAGDTLWLDWAIFGPDAEHLSEHVVKGSKITIVGKLKARSYQTRDGDKRTVTEITADSIAVHATKQQSATAGQGSGWDTKAEPRGGDDPWSTEKAPF